MLSRLSFRGIKYFPQKFLNPFVRMHQSQEQQPTLDTEFDEEYVNALQQKVAAFEQSQPYFVFFLFVIFVFFIQQKQDRLMFFDPDMMATLPVLLDRFDPAVEAGKDALVTLHDFVGVPWWGVLGMACLMARTTLLPLIYLQMKRTSKLAAVVPAIVQMKKLIDTSGGSGSRRFYYMTRVTFDIVRKQKLKFMRLFLFNVFHFPLLITLIWSIRRLLVEPSVQATSLLWLPSLSAIDPYFILPLMTVGCYYMNLQRFITPDNRDTIPSKLRIMGQFLLIVALPFLCNWPSAMVLYMFYNALFSYLQTSLMVHPTFQKFVDPKMMLYQLILRVAEYDNQQSRALVESIQSGEETLLDKAIEEERLVDQMRAALVQLNQQETDSIIKKNEDNYNKF